jgi:hypothetical protein
MERIIRFHQSKIHKFLDWTQVFWIRNLEDWAGIFCYR